jgi:hypothetical protein
MQKGGLDPVTNKCTYLKINHNFAGKIIKLKK